jgi:hypothetical protein
MLGFVEWAKRHVGELAGPWELGPGAHVCCVVSTSDEVEQWARRCLTDGAFAGQKPFHVSPRAHALPFEREGGVTHIDPTRSRSLSIESVFEMYRRETAKAREEGFTGMRVLSDMRWTSAFPALRPHLAALELRLDEVIAELDATVICVYGEREHSRRELTEAVAVHPLTSGVPAADPGFRIWNLDRGTWEIAGEIDRSNVDLFGRTLSAILANGPVRRLRCGGLRYISAAGIMALSRLGRAQPDRALVIHEASPMLRRCWAIFELDVQLPQVGFEPAAGSSEEVPR